MTSPDPPWIIAMIRGPYRTASLLSSAAVSVMIGNTIAQIWQDVVRLWWMSSLCCVLARLKRLVGLCRYLVKLLFQALSEHVGAGRAFSHHRSRPKFSPALFVPARRDALKNEETKGLSGFAPPKNSATVMYRHNSIFYATALSDMIVLGVVSV